MRAESVFAARAKAAPELLGSRGEPRILLGRSGLACRKRQPQKYSREHQEHHANAGRVTGEVNDGDDEEQQAR
jgi:hypothetical protein